MKTLQLTMALFIAIAATRTGAAQTTTAGNSGLYLSANDFLQHKLSNEINCSGSDKLETHGLLGSASVTVVKNGQKQSFPKNQLYGYRDCKGRDYRFYNHDTYRILDTAGFFIYYGYKYEQGPGGKGLVKTDEYYFSTEGNSQLIVLNIDNLKKAFPANDRFHYQIDEECKTDKDLVAYDGFLKTYKIKYLYSQSSK
ncbi:MAG TPA: hypothetical protein VLD19_12015 [Chitinophagaceae bacterium]|nr:hypothetical protein [Chitinophagaceae bacterium]